MTAAAIATALGGAHREGRDCGWSLTLPDGREGRLFVPCWGGGCETRELLTELRWARADQRPSA
jgi:hypothetical protein